MQLLKYNDFIADVEERGFGYISNKNITKEVIVHLEITESYKRIWKYK